ncbi:MAG: DUF423 domain-containing protein [Cyclobacteriaceae bacterium]|nr:DUF423 domain-containing protein [Cyclobacteriaceae bacterium]
MTQKLILSIAAISGALAVGLGAFGAHALKAKLEATERLSTYQTAVQYHFYHTFALLAIGLLLYKTQSSWLNYSSYMMIAGILFFSGSLYALCLSGVRWLGAITPIGGIFFILGWLFLLMGVLKTQN